MTDIDFKIALPFIFTFIFIGLFRLLVMFAGLPLVESVAFAALFLSTIAGVIVGGVFAGEGDRKSRRLYRGGASRISIPRRPPPDRG